MPSLASIAHFTTPLPPIVEEWVISVQAVDGRRDYYFYDHRHFRQAKHQLDQMLKDPILAAKKPELRLAARFVTL